METFWCQNVFAFVGYGSPLVRLLAEFVYLQVLDLLTTVTFLMQGVGEANPLVRWALGIDSNPVVGLVAVKLLALGLALFCIYRSRTLLLRRVNVFFACLVAYNMVIVVLTSPAIS